MLQIIIISTTFISTIGFCKQSTKLVPSTPQKEIIHTFPSSSAYKYFSFEIVDKPAAKFTKNDGVSGIDIISTSLEKGILLTIFINLFKVFPFLINFLNKGLRPTRHKKNAIKLPNTVQMYETMLPKMLPIVRKLIVTKTNIGRKAKVPSSTIRQELSKGAHIPAFNKNVFKFSFNPLKNSNISINYLIFYYISLNDIYIINLFLL